MISKSNAKFTDGEVGTWRVKLNKLFGVIMRLTSFALKQCLIKQLLDSVFVISEIIKISVSVSVIRFGYCDI